MPDLLLQFIRSFQKAIAEEMHAMRQRMGPFEVLLTNARALDTVQNSNGNLFFYTFEAVTQNDKLTLHAECTLTCDGRESLVTITELEKSEDAPDPQQVAGRWLGEDRDFYAPPWSGEE